MENLEDLLSLKTVYCHHSTSLPPGNSPLHLHNHYELFLFLAGDVRYFIEDNFYQLKRGDLLIFNSNELHGPQFLSNQVYERISIHIAPSVIKQLSSTSSNLLNCFLNRINGQNNLVRLSPTDLDNFVVIADKICDLDKKNFFGKDVLINALTAQQLVTTNLVFIEGETAAIETTISPLIQETLQHIKSHLTDDLSLETLETVLSFDRYHLSKRFKKEIGSSIYQYILLKRISKAKELLFSGLSVSDTCSQAGFNDYANFIRTFKRTTGYSPTNFVKQHK